MKIRHVKKIILITSTFPPRGGSSVQRVVKHIKYSNGNKISYTVVTCDEESKVNDPSLFNDLPSDLKIIRFARCPKFLKLRIFEAILNRLVYPDRYALWSFGVLLGLRSIIRETKFDGIFVSVGSTSALLVATLLSRLYRLPLVIDFRDLRSCDLGTYAVRPRRSLFQKLDRTLIRFSLASNCRVTTVSHAAKITLQNNYAIDDSKVQTIYNGFDPSDFGLKEDVVTDETRIRIRYIGYIVNGKSFEVLNKALKVANALRRKHSLPQLLIEVMGDNIGSSVSQPSGTASISDDIVFLPYAPHHEAVRFVQGADILLLFCPAGPGMITGKFFEYVAALRPILHLSDENEELEYLISTYSLGASVNIHGMHELVDKLVNVESFMDIDLGHVPEIFSRVYQAEQFESCIMEACK